MSNSLIDLGEITYEDYLLAEEYINESLLLKNREEKEIENTLSKLSELSKVISPDKLTLGDIDNLNNVANELNNEADKIKNIKVKTYLCISVISKVVEIIDKIISTISFVKSLKTTDSSNNNTIEDENVEKGSRIKILFKTIFSKETLKSTIKSLFTLKNIIKTLLTSINKVIGKYNWRMYKTEKDIDKGYEILLNCEAKMILEKKKAKENKDKDTESACDEVINFISKFKKEREKQRAIEQSKNESSILVEEYKGDEYKLTTFRLICRDLGEALDIDLSNLKSYCNTALYTIRRVLEMNDENKDKKFTSIQNKIKETDNYIKDPDRQYNGVSLQALFSKYSHMFSNTYSNFGMKIREDFESKLENYAIEMNKVINDYKIELSIIITGKENNSIESSIDQLKTKLSKKLSKSNIDKVYKLFDEVNDNSKRTIDNCMEFIKSIKQISDSNKIKSDLKYVIFKKLFG